MAWWGLLPAAARCSGVVRLFDRTFSRESRTHICTGWAGLMLELARESRTAL